jgi:predicted nucleic acid-binding protein
MPTGPERRPNILLDTSAYAWLRTGHADVLSMVADADVVWIPAVVLGELEAGFELGSRPRENRALLAELGLDTCTLQA